jgi:type VI secretion system secreted protein VgrG
MTLPADRPATPHRAIPRPRIDGLQIALIAGPPGEEIHTDAFGRIKLQFPWDRRARGNGTDTGWVRVTQSWSGTQWGQQIIPRVGMEALVAYQEGDPDRPIVIGIAPNPNNSVPYDLPANKTRMVMRSNSYKSNGFNEMIFEDATGAENMFFHAQKDHTTKIENNQTHSVGADHANVVGRNQALTVGANQTQEIGGSLNITVGGTGRGLPP